jgi:hypothetical protein
LPIGSAGDPDDPDELVERIRLLARRVGSAGAWPHEIAPAEFPRYLANFIVTPEKRRFSFVGRPWLPELAIALVTEREVAEEKASQIGASVLNLIAAFYLMARGFFRSGVAYFFPTDNDLKDLSTTKADPILRNSYLADFTDERTNNVYRKELGGVWIYFRGSKASIRLKSFSVDMVAIDEADEIPAEAQKMAEQRMHASDVQWLRHFSKPSVPGYGINASFAKTDQRYWTIRCPGCRHEFAFEDTFPKCVAVVRGEGFRCCPKCRREVLLEDGRWVQRNPGARSVGFHVSQMLSPTIDPGELLRDFETTTRIGEFWRGRMGVPFVESSGRVDEKTILDLCSLDRPNVRESGSGCYLGVDVGRLFHWVAKRRVDRKLVTVGIGTCASFEDLRYLLLAFRVEKAVIDALPEAHAAIRFSQAPGLYGKVWTCIYDTGKKPVPPKWQRVEQDGERDFLRVTAHRTKTLDQVLAGYRETAVELPKKDPTVEEFARHVSALVRIEDEDEETGEVSHRYVQTGPDHWGHADGYANLAAGEWRGPSRSIVVYAR